MIYSRKTSGFWKSIKTPPFYACRCYPGFLVTIGGIKINERMEVLKQDNAPIPGFTPWGLPLEDGPARRMTSVSPGWLRFPGLWRPDCG